MSSDEASSFSLVDAVVRRVDEHSFYPIENGFTVDPETGYDGVPDRESMDWHVRTLAVRDLVRLGREAARPMAEALGHDNPHVRQIAAMALGILRAEAETHTDVRPQCRVALHRTRKGEPVEAAVAERFATLEESTFGRVQKGEEAPDFTLEDTEGQPWRLSDVRGQKTVVLLWIFADWCPVCHKEFHGLIHRADRFREQNVEVATIECHDRYRCRVMEGKEIRPDYWFADNFPDDRPQAPYPEKIWWPHLVDRAAAVGLRHGIDPWQFAVHSEWVNRPSTIIVDPDGIVRLAYFGDYWGDRPSITQILEMVETGEYEFCVVDAIQGHKSGRQDRVAREGSLHTRRFWTGRGRRFLREELRFGSRGGHQGLHPSGYVRVEPRKVVPFSRITHQVVQLDLPIFVEIGLPGVVRGRDVDVRNGKGEIEEERPALVLANEGQRRIGNGGLAIGALFDRRAGARRLPRDVSRALTSA